MNNAINFKAFEALVSGNASVDIPNVYGALDAIVISKDQDTSNVAKAVTIVATLADGFTQQFGALTVGNTPVIVHPRKQAVAADLSTAVAGVYDRWHLAGKVTVTVASGDAGDVTRVRLIIAT